MCANGYVFFRKVFPYHLRALEWLFFSSTKFLLTSSHGFIYLQSSILLVLTRSSSVFFPFLCHRTRRTRGCQAKVWYRTRNNKQQTRLGFAAGDSQPCDPWCRRPFLSPPRWNYIFSMFFYIFCLVTQYIIHLKVYWSSKFCIPPLG